MRIEEMKFQIFGILLVAAYFVCAEPQFGQFRQFFGGQNFPQIQQQYNPFFNSEQQQQQDYTSPDAVQGDEATAPAEEQTDVDTRFSADDGTNHNKPKKSRQPEYETHHPCNSRILTQVRPHGKVTPEKNYWDATLDLTDYAYLRSIKIVVRVDNQARIEVDPNEGTISGPDQGKTFRVTFHGTPEEVSEVKFRVIGVNGVKFPNLVSLHLNNRDICQDVTNWVDNLTGALLDTTHNLGLGGLLGGLGQAFMGNNQYQQPSQGYRPPPVRTTTPKPTTKPTRRNLPGCGRRQINQQAYITEGYASKPGDFPWHAALYHRTSRSSSYKCGGTLISDHVVLTAAHCLYANGKQIIPEKVTVQLGKFNLNIIDGNTVEYQVFNITVHPEYSPVDFQDDLALLKLAEKVTYTQYIQPACLWKESEKALSFVENKAGTVVGWGLTEEDQLAEVLNEGTMPVVSFFECLESDRDFFGPFLSDFNYCAGYRNGTSVCNGDSGGGMFFEKSGQWYIRGLVSFSSVREDRDVCNPKNYVIFTDAAKYLTWIDTNMK